MRPGVARRGTAPSLDRLALSPTLDSLERNASGGLVRRVSPLSSVVRGLPLAPRSSSAQAREYKPGPACGRGSRLALPGALARRPDRVSHHPTRFVRLHGPDVRTGGLRFDLE